MGHAGEGVLSDGGFRVSDLTGEVPSSTWSPKVSSEKNGPKLSTPKRLLGYVLLGSRQVEFPKPGAFLWTPNHRALIVGSPGKGPPIYRKSQVSKTTSKLGRFNDMVGDDTWLQQFVVGPDSAVQHPGCTARRSNGPRVAPSGS